MDLYLSLSSYGGLSTRQALTTISAAGIQHVELAIGVKPDRDAAEAIQDFRSQGMMFRAHHAFVWEEWHRSFNLAQPIDQVYFQRMIDWLAAMGIQDYSVHPGSYRKTADREVAWQQFLENLGWVGEYCRCRGIRLAVETMYPTREADSHGYFLDDLSSIVKLCESMPELWWVVDLSHLNIWPKEGLDQRLQVMDCLSDRLLEIHISDNDGVRDLHTAISDQTWWLPYRSRLPYSVPWVLETRLNGRSASVLQSEYARVLAYF